MRIDNICVYGMFPAILGIRNSYKSKEKSDSMCIRLYDRSSSEGYISYNHCVLGKEDERLIRKLLKSKNNPHYEAQERKFLRQIDVGMDITGTIKFWAQMDTFKVGTVRNSESTMHSITKGEITQKDFEIEVNDGQLSFINRCIKKHNTCEDAKLKESIFNIIDANLPAGYVLESYWTGNYEVLRNIYHGRKNHKMYWWKEFCDVIKKLPYADLLIIGEKE
ncbi:MAG: hypothetical protein EHM12_08135 [Dehalococcoidia bacterium]|nr:MAG: hypothetical protein EHM12_08135 [Dehalococcoidia bacterium]